jgi:chromosome segregation ATPase
MRLKGVKSKMSWKEYFTKKTGIEAELELLKEELKFLREKREEEERRLEETRMLQLERRIYELSRKIEELKSSTPKINPNVLEALEALEELRGLLKEFTKCRKYDLKYLG